MIRIRNYDIMNNYNILKNKYSSKKFVIHKMACDWSNKISSNFDYYNLCKILIEKEIK